MSAEKDQESLMVEKSTNEKEKIGIERRITQIYDTILFEFIRHWKIFLLLLVVFASTFILYYVLNEFEYAQGVEIPEDPVNYIKTYLGLFNMLIIISTATLGSTIIAEDFNKQTGNLLFPKIDKSRLLIGRTIARYALNALLVIFYYILIAVVTNSMYGEVPEVLFDSLMWALLYLFTITAFVIFMSSINKSASNAMIVSILFLLIVFLLIENLLMMSGMDVEPLFLPTYYYNIVGASLDMPDERYVEVLRPTSEEGVYVEFKMWTTPSPIDALNGMLIFSGIFLIAAYIIYKRRQSKN